MGLTSLITEVSAHDTQAEMLLEGIEIPVGVQQFVPALDAAHRDHRIDCFADGHAEVAQRSEVSRRLNRDLLYAQGHNRWHSMASASPFLGPQRGSLVSNLG